MARRRAEVAVIGAGPAGCAAACTLGRIGIDVTVFEQGQPGKDKACGDALVPSATDLLGHHGIDQGCIASLGGYPFTRMDIYNRDSLILQAGFGDKRGWVIRRALLDQKLRDVCSQYAAIRYGTSIVDVTAEPGGILNLRLRCPDGSDEEFSCDAAILANGSGSLLSRKWGISGHPIRVASIRGYTRIERRPDNLVTQFTEACRPGYGWVFPLATGEVNIGVCTLSPSNVRGLQGLVAEYSAEWGAPQHCQWRGGSGALWSSKGRIWHRQVGIVSCGDAAGLMDPLSGEGMTAALLSGEQAGVAVSLYLRENRHEERLAQYSRWVSGHFSRVYRRTQQRQIWANLCRI